jgi:fluoride exporter
MELTLTAGYSTADGSYATRLRRSQLFSAGDNHRTTAEEAVKLFWAIAVGAAAGGVSRFYLAAAIQQRLGASFPWGTLAINITGSLLLGFLIRYALATPAISLEMRAMLTVGFCGGYTTFSSYSYETMVMLEEGQFGRAALYSLGSVVLALFATFAGFVLARELIAFRQRF